MGFFLNLLVDDDDLIWLKLCRAKNIVEHYNSNMSLTNLMVNGYNPSSSTSTQDLSRVVDGLKELSNEFLVRIHIIHPPHSTLINSKILTYL